MREFFKIMGHYFAPYKKYVAGTLSFNVLSAFFNVFSFTLLLPILNILFQIDKGTYHLMSFSDGSFKDVALNNLYYYSQQLINHYGAVWWPVRSD